MAFITLKRNAIDNEITLPSCFSSSYESTIRYFRKKFIISSIINGYSIIMDTKNNLSFIKRTKIKQRRAISKKEINRKDVSNFNWPLSSTNLNILIKNKNLNLSHSSCPSKRYCCRNEMPKREWFRLAKTNSFILENITRYLYYFNYRLGLIILLWIFRC